MGNICCGEPPKEESEYSKIIKAHRDQNPDIKKVLKSSDYKPDAMSGPQRKKQEAGHYTYSEDIDESLKYTD